MRHLDVNLSNCGKSKLAWLPNSVFCLIDPTGTSTLYRRIHLLSHVYSITEDNTPLPPPLDDPVADAALLEREPWIEAPVKVDYGFNVKLGEGVFINFNCVFIDTCPIIVGARTLFGPSVHIYSGTHPLDPALRNGLQGPESGKPVVIGEDCWLAGNVTVLPGITIGRGCTIGAGSVVTKVCICSALAQACLHLCPLGDCPDHSLI